MHEVGRQCLETFAEDCHFFQNQVRILLKIIYVNAIKSTSTSRFENYLLTNSVTHFMHLLFFCSLWKHQDTGISRCFQGYRDPASIYLFKVNNRNTRARCEICSKLTIKTPERRHWRRSGVFIVTFEHISHLNLVFLLLTLDM